MVDPACGSYSKEYSWVANSDVVTFWTWRLATTSRLWRSWQNEHLWKFSRYVETNRKKHQFTSVIFDDFPALLRFFIYWLCLIRSQEINTPQPNWNLFIKVTVVACEGPSMVIRSSTVAIWGALMAKRVFAPIWSKSFHRSFCPANTCPQTVRRSQLSARNVRFSWARRALLKKRVAVSEPAVLAHKFSIPINLY